MVAIVLVATLAWFGPGGSELPILWKGLFLGATRKYVDYIRDIIGNENMPMLITMNIAMVSRNGAASDFQERLIFTALNFAIR